MFFEKVGTSLDYILSSRY